VDEVFRDARQVGDLDLQIACHEELIFMHLALGDRSTAERLRDAHDALARTSRTRGDDWRATALRAMFALVDGRHVEAEQLILKANDVAGTWSWTWLQQMFDLRRRQGRFEEVWKLVEEAREQRPWWPHLDLVSALAYADTGDLERAAVHLGRARVDLLVESNVKEDWWCSALAEIAEVVSRVGDSQIARTAYDGLLPFANLNVEVSAFGTYSGPVAHDLGLLATTLRDWNAAERHFEAALAMNERMRARPFLAESQFAYADMLVRRGEPADRQKALELVDQALVVAEEIGMTRLATLARSLKEQLQRAVDR
ncbi:MAG: hypothetical protein ACRD1H_15950, partial [Vicinamibacterales bacterium]